MITKFPSAAAAYGRRLTSRRSAGDLCGHRSTNVVNVSVLHPPTSFTATASFPCDGIASEFFRNHESSEFYISLWVMTCPPSPFLYPLFSVTMSQFPRTIPSSHNKAAPPQNHITQKNFSNLQKNIYRNKTIQKTEESVAVKLHAGHCRCEFGRSSISRHIQTKLVNMTCSNMKLAINIIIFRADFLSVFSCTYLHR